MRVAVTGTPGVGKTTATSLLTTDLGVVHLNDLIAEADLYDGTDEERRSRIADLDAIRERLDGRDDVVVESHLAHHLSADRVVVLRCHPGELRRRLEARGEPAAKVEENAAAEALDLLLAEAVDRHGEDRVYEIDTTDLDSDAVAGEIDAVIGGRREPAVGTVSYLEYL